jgi:hypothetical protein
MPGRSQKDLYDMRKPEDIFKPIILVKQKDGTYKQQNLEQIKAAEGKSDGEKKDDKKKGGKRRTLKKRTLKKRKTRKYKIRY